MPEISVVLPLLNQADHVARIVDGHLAALEQAGIPGELILVPNGCTDGTITACETLARQHPNVLVTPADVAGWGRAVRLGLHAATSPIIGYANSARTSSEALVLVARMALANPDSVVKTSRKVRHSPLRRAASAVFTLECQSLFDLAVWDINSTPKFFPRKFEELLHLTESGDLIDLEFCIACHRAGRPIIEIPLYGDTRHGGRSTTTWRTAATLYVGALRMWRGMR